MKKLRNILLTGLLLLLLPLVALSGANSWTGSGPYPTETGNQIVNALATSPDGQTVYAGMLSGTVLSYSFVPPIVITSAASVTTATGSTLNGSVNAQGGSFSTLFRYGTTSGVYTSSPATPGTASGSSATLISASLTGLVPNTTYYFRAEATGGSTVQGSELTFTTGKLAQSITFANPASQVFGTTPTLVAGASSGLPMAFSSGTPGVCTITSGGTLSFITTGACTIHADQGGNSSYSAAGRVTQTFTVGKATPVMAWATPAAIAFGTPLSGTQLNASSGGVAGTFVYTPSSGSLLNAAPGQVLSVTFTPTNTAVYNTPPALTVSITVSAANQSITFGAAPLLGYSGAIGSVSATATSGLPVSFTSTTPLICSVSGAVVSSVTPGTCTIAASQGGNANFNSAPVVMLNISTGVVTGYTAPSATGSGNITASFTGGGAGCGYSVSQFIAVSGVASPPPPGATFPHGLFDFSTKGCTPGSTLTFTITYPQAVQGSTRYWKFGPTPTDAVAHWYVLPASVAGQTVVFSITDGGWGDDDLTVNGTLVDAGGPAWSQAGAGAAGIPTLSEWGVMVLSGLLMLLGLRNVSRRR